MPIDSNRLFLPLNISILTVSDTRSLDQDRSGDTLEALAKQAGHLILERKIVQDEPAEILEAFSQARDNPKINVLISTGGTGITARDITPETFKLIVEKSLSGFGEIFRAQSFAKIGTSALQSRACAGVAGQTIYFILPGSPGACKDAWNLIVEMLDNRFRPCNLTEMLPRMSTNHSTSEKLNKT